MNAAKKRRVIVLAVVLAAVLALVIAMAFLHGSVEYQIMSQTEQLKAQLQRERQVYSQQLFEKVEVQRPWYILSPEKWTYAVTFAEDPETVYYRRAEQGFVLSGP